MKGSVTKSMHLQWMVVHNCSSFLIKRNSLHSALSPIIRRPATPSDTTGRFTTRPWAWSQRPQQRCGGHHEVEIQPLKAGHLLRAERHQHERPGPAQQHPEHDLQNKYRPDLRIAAACKASAILRSQEPVTLKKKQAPPTQSFSAYPPQSNKA
ncbi:large ribosomal subunit protein eL28-like [Hipposideros larvatus]